MTTTLTFDAGILARGWLATHLATGADEALPILYGTLAIEAFPTGVRLTATDRTVLLSAWVPDADHTGDGDGPAFDIGPDSTTVVRDPDGRGRALLTYLRKLAQRAAKDSEPAPIVALHLGVPADEGDESGFPGMELEQVLIDYPDHERVALPTVDGTFPDYRALLLGHVSKRTDVVNLGGENMARLGMVAKTIGGYVRCSLAGPTSAIAVEVGSVFSPPLVRGVVMPISVAEAVEQAS